MRIFDLSQRLGPGMQVFPGYPGTAFIPWAKLDIQGYASEALFCITHAGTHLDAPLHFVAGGKGVHEIPLTSVHVPAIRADLRTVGAAGRIGRTELSAALRGRKGGIRGTAVLLWTGWDRHLGTADYLQKNPGLTEDGAGYLRDQGAALVGIDCANLDHPEDTAFPAHHVLLGAGVPILENLTRLGAVPQDTWTLSAVPLNLDGASGSPVRAIAILDGDQ